MNVGWQRTYETEALIDFAKVVERVARLNENDAWLQEFKRKVFGAMLIAVMTEKEDIKNGNILTDRLHDCEYCHEWNNIEKPCARKRCIYNTAKWRFTAIKSKIGKEEILEFCNRGKILLEGMR